VSLARAVLFDRDGVLTYFDFSPLLPLIANLPLSFDQLRQRWEDLSNRTSGARDTVGERALIREFWSSILQGSAEAALRLEQLASFDYARIFRAYPDALATLSQLRLRGLRIGVLSNFPLVRVEDSLHFSGFSGLFDVALAAPALGVAKPHPAAYRAALAALDVAECECVFVDDELTCVEGARAIGIRACLLKRGSGGCRADALPDLNAFSAWLDSAPSHP
jgi:putative hydrolase of the HAD superfamily